MVSPNNHLCIKKGRVPLETKKCLNPECKNLIYVFTKNDFNITYCSQVCYYQIYKVEPFVKKCLNPECNNLIHISVKSDCNKKYCSKNCSGKILGNKIKNDKKGIFGLTKMQVVERSKKSNETNKKKGLGIYNPKNYGLGGKAGGKKGDETNRRNKTGIYSITKEQYREKRKNQILPKKDTSIEVKIQNFLKQLNIEFLTHQYMKIEHGYQYDIYIPSLNLVIECFGTYWHKYPLGREVDTLRCKELREKGYNVLVFWENEIHAMEVDDLRNKLHELVI